MIFEKIAMFENNLERKHPKVFNFYNCLKCRVLAIIKYSPFGYRTILENLGHYKRKHFPNLPSRYSSIKNLKGIHKGKKCFILATGPSLTIEDVNLLKLRSGGGGIITLSLNEIVAIYDKTDWRPDYYLMIDRGALKGLLNMGYDIWNSMDHDRILLAHFFKSYRNSLSIPEDIIYFRHFIRTPSSSPDREKAIKFSDDFFAISEDGFSVTYACIELAVYMGCTEIYLLGCDCNYNGTNDYLEEFKYASAGKYPQEMLDKCAYYWRCGYKLAKEYADSHGIKIYNATRGGKLEIFERVKLEDALKA